MQILFVQNLAVKQNCLILNNMNCLCEITDSVHDVIQRVRAIDDNYRIYYNYKTDKFELHHLQCRPSKQLILPFKQLTKETVDYVASTRIDKIIDEYMDIDNYNAKLEEKYYEKVIDKASYLSKDLFNYINHGGSEIPLKI